MTQKAQTILIKMWDCRIMRSGFKSPASPFWLCELEEVTLPVRLLSLSSVTAKLLAVLAQVSHYIICFLSQ